MGSNNLPLRVCKLSHQYRGCKGMNAVSMFKTKVNLPSSELNGKGLGTVKEE